MELPRRCIVDEIDVLVVAELLPLLGAACIDLGGGAASLCGRVERTLDAHGVKVANRGDFAAGDCVEAIDAGSTAPKAHDADPELLERLVGESRHRPSVAEAEALCRGAADDSSRRTHPRRTLKKLPAICFHVVLRFD